MALLYVKGTWVDDDGSGTVGTVFTAARMANIESGVYMASAPIVTTLPSSPTDGQEVNYLADATNGILWHLVYRASDSGGSSGTSKWLFTGGQSLDSYDDLNFNQALGTFTTWVFPTTRTFNPKVVLPLAGDYRVEYGHGSWDTAASSYIGCDIAITPSGGSTTFVANNASACWVQNPTGQAQVQENSRRFKKITGRAANDSLEMCWYASSATANLRNPQMSVTPIRVG